jgi:hypothetical protein
MKTKTKTKKVGTVVYLTTSNDEVIMKGKITRLDSTTYTVRWEDGKENTYNK